MCVCGGGTHSSTGRVLDGDGELPRAAALGEDVLTGRGEGVDAAVERLEVHVSGDGTLAWGGTDREVVSLSFTFREAAP